ncbi:hypothetical protein L3Q82_017717, partial [Scortum barcoo]
MRLMKVLHCLKDYGLRLSPEKCQFFRSSVKYLGHVVDAQGVHTDPDKVSALKDWPCPVNREELKQFLGFAGYYRRFVEGYSRIAGPLNFLTVGYYLAKKSGKAYKRDRPKNCVHPRAPFDADWTSDCKSAFRTLIDKLTSSPVIAFADPKLPYMLHTDACCEDLGAAVYQEQGGKLRVIAYASRGLSKNQRADQEDEDFIQEKERIEAIAKRILEGEEREIPTDVISALCHRLTVISLQLPVLAESLAIDASSVPELFAVQGQTTLPGMTKECWYKAQREDPSIRKVISLLDGEWKPIFKTVSTEKPEVKLLLREWNRLELHRRCFDQLVLPAQYRDRALRGLHDEVGHLGPERVLSLARARFYWPKRKESIDKKCGRCFRRKAQPQRAAPMVNIKTTYPLKLVCMDYLSLEPDSHDTRNILVITDHFTKFTVAVPTKDRKARTIARALWENFLVHYGFSSRLHSDQGRDLLGTLEEKDKQHWRDFVKPLVHAYNCTRNDTI